ncbi:endonuclease/exonuclease/phosphatase family protein [Rhodobacter sp. Har01]|uniref:endonuclease/exonuclease/phosphatase family protein n=1 Tax=Rhodobacter sp. Har01 TaxID=2883999 RepID=UPI001D088BDC|nr:endonuclease/exonuclease/phosphatase family protein [Rhodobacter sp. Har01]MCB6177020.1 endonuclease/exonuclease/phosphatase family protein [Rhodobacter sp. Har01]
MRIASYNVENLFDRARIMNLPDWSDGRPVLEDFKALTDLLEQPAYGNADKARILELMAKLDLLASDQGPYVTLRRNRGQLVVRRRDGTVDVVANGRADWIGWLELRTEAVNATAIRNTAQVIRDLRADILTVIEAENRTALMAFNDDLLATVGGVKAESIMLIDGNDARGIDVGLLTGPGHAIGLMRSHVNEGRPVRAVFSRDCPEYQVTTPAGEVVWVLPCHFKSKGFGSPRDNDAKRLREATAVAGYVSRLLAEGAANVVVLGDMNDTPDSAPLAPLFGHPNLHAAHTHPTWQVQPPDRPGTRMLGAKSDHIDHILLSDALWARMTAGGVFRRGAWPGKRTRHWDAYPEIEREIHAASDHHAVWVELT